MFLINSKTIRAVLIAFISILFVGCAKTTADFEVSEIAPEINIVSDSDWVDIDVLFTDRGEGAYDLGSRDAMFVSSGDQKTYFREKEQSVLLAIVSFFFCLTLCDLEDAYTASLYQPETGASFEFGFVRNDVVHEFSVIFDIGDLYITGSSYNGVDPTSSDLQISIAGGAGWKVYDYLATVGQCNGESYDRSMIASFMDGLDYVVSSNGEDEIIVDYDEMVSGLGLVGIANEKGVEQICDVFISIGLSTAEVDFGNLSSQTSVVSNKGVVNIELTFDVAVPLSEVAL